MVRKKEIKIEIEIKVKGIHSVPEDQSHRRDNNRQMEDRKKNRFMICYVYASMHAYQT